MYMNISLFVSLSLFLSLPLSLYIYVHPPQKKIYTNI